MSVEMTASPKKRAIEWLPTQEPVPVLYTNSIEFKLSVLDITLSLGVIVKFTEEKVITRPTADVILSPQHAKILSSLLVEHLQKYEETFGTIPSPPKQD